MIALTQSLPSEDACVATHVWPLRISATAGEGEDSKVFVYKREPSLYVEDIFWNVASLSEMQTVPEDDPAPGDVFFRTSTAQYHARSREEALAVWYSVLDSVELLNANIAVLDDLSAETYVSEMITLTKHTVTNVLLEGQHVWPLRIIASSNDAAVSAKIFVFHAAVPNDTYSGDIFEAVASVQQLNELPEDSAGLDVNGEMCPYFRVDSLTFYARSAAEADDLWNEIISDVDDLTRNLQVNTNTSETYTSTGD